MSEYLKEIRQSSSNDILEELALEGFKEKLIDLLNSEIDEYLGHKKYERIPEGSNSYRNGSSKPRHISIGSGTTYIEAPRLREQFESEILRKYQSEVINLQR
ncbi:MAG: hypothetical protein FJ213_02655 [Ignavibacteria bacterium]|nr:hypothetical protein [Ignavibacteria bacterium]